MPAGCSSPPSCGGTTVTCRAQASGDSITTLLSDNNSRGSDDNSKYVSGARAPASRGLLPYTAYRDAEHQTQARKHERHRWSTAPHYIEPVIVMGDVRWLQAHWKTTENKISIARYTFNSVFVLSFLHSVVSCSAQLDVCVLGMGKRCCEIPQGPRREADLPGAAARR